MKERNAEYFAMFREIAFYVKIPPFWRSFSQQNAMAELHDQRVIQVTIWDRTKTYSF